MSDGGDIILFSASMYYAGAGYWSHCINDEHRIVYKVQGAALLVALSRCKV
jgi:Txe/YoeB family toxin of Txe-Axe toxin-antitoxin module